ncbi:carbohydrate sulfotransferase 1-like isoform X1 [Diadema antillarum]|uniref:carbohydrate sulfotransferase 1-like isoform X1 n=1 Tax=Diadema antillarum TaxID=105358 RepID=UPI003A849CB3
MNSHGERLAKCLFLLMTVTMCSMFFAARSILPGNHELIKSYVVSSHQMGMARSVIVTVPAIPQSDEPIWSNIPNNASITNEQLSPTTEQPKNRHALHFEGKPDNPGDVTQRDESDMIRDNERDLAANVPVTKKQHPLKKVDDDRNMPFQRLQIVIVTTKRSGSSFVGELFNSNPNIFYMFEPLHRITFDALAHRLPKSIPITELSFSIWNHTLRCNYSTTYPAPGEWLSILNKHKIDPCKYVNGTSVPSAHCQLLGKPLGERAGRALSLFCADHPVTVLKTIRVMDIEELRPFLEDPGLNVKILHLLRDPRAVMDSRRRLAEVNSDLIRRRGRGADEILDLCQHMERNIRYNDSPPSWLRGKYVMVRFEDVASNPVDEARRIYRKLGLPLHADVVMWIDRNTRTAERENDPFSRTRNSTEVLSAWQRTLPAQTRKNIESRCQHLLEKLSYDIMQ